MTTVRVAFEFTTDAPQDRAVLRRSLRDTLNTVADRYAGQVTKGSVIVRVDPEATVMARFQDTMEDLLNEGVDPDDITMALARLGFGKAAV